MWVMMDDSFCFVGCSKGREHRPLLSRLVLLNRLVPPVLPFTLLPVVLEVVHLVALVVEVVLSEGVLETALSALADEEEDEQSQQDRPGGGSANVDTGFGA